MTKASLARRLKLQAIHRFVPSTDALTGLPKRPFAQRVRLGSAYGGWWVPADLQFATPPLTLSFGAGTDISFDLDVANRWAGPVYIADPTPEAIRHVQTTLGALRNGQPAYRDNRKDTPYSASTQAAALLQLHPYGWWKADGVLRFRKPEQQDHVSLSAVETAVPEGETLLELPVHTLPTLLAQYGLPSPDILKLDIEGAEYAVLPQILALSPLPRLICVELHGQDLKQDAGEARGFLSALLKVGYSIGDSDLYGNYTLVRK